MSLTYSLAYPAYYLSTTTPDFTESYESRMEDRRRVRSRTDIGNRQISDPNLALEDPPNHVLIEFCSFWRFILV